QRPVHLEPFHLLGPFLFLRFPFHIFPVHGSFISFDLCQDITFLDLITRFFKPASNRPLLHGITESWHCYFAHCFPLLRRGASSLIASRSCLEPVSVAISRGFEYGNGTSRLATRLIGASRSSNASSCSVAAISAPIPYA